MATSATFLQLPLSAMQTPSANDAGRRIPANSDGEHRRDDLRQQKSTRKNREKTASRGRATISGSSGELWEQSQVVDKTFDSFFRTLLNVQRVNRPTFGLAAAIAVKKLNEQDRIVFDQPDPANLTILSAFKHRDDVLRARLVQINGQPADIQDRNTAKAIICDLKEQRFKIDGISDKTVYKSPPLPLTTGKLISKSEKYLGFSARQTMETARSLASHCYVGLKKPVLLITSPITDSLFIPENDILAAREYIFVNYNKNYLPEKPRLYSEKKDMTFSVIRPALISRTPGKIKKHVSEPQYQLYDLIWRRFLACQMTDACVVFRKIVISAGPQKRYIFYIEQSQTADRGYLQLFPEAANQNSILFAHELQKNAELFPVDFSITQKEKYAAFHYTEGRLIEALADADVCLNETLEYIPDILKEWKLMRKTDEGKIFPTSLGREACRLLLHQYPDIVNDRFVRLQKKRLVQNSGKQPKENNPAGELLKLLQHAGRPTLASGLSGVTGKKTREKCPACGGSMLRKQSETGDFLVCEHYPQACHYSKSVPTHIQRYYGRCDTCNAELTVKIGRYGRFLACSTFPKCTFTRPYPIGVKCPNEGCDGEVIERTSKGGRLFYRCSRFPKCRFSSWQMPVNIACPTCSHLYLVAKTGENLDLLRCPKCGAEFDQNLKTTR